MSLITRCPACETMFKVVADQLRISEGWVRCGQCAQVFNASAHLVHETPPPAASRDPVPDPAVDASLDAPADPLPVRGPETASTPAAVAPPVPVAAPYPRDDTPVAAPPDAGSAPEVSPGRYRPSQPAALDSGPSPLQAAPNLPAAKAVPIAENEDANVHQDLSFVRQGRRRAFWQRPLVRVSLLLVLLSLAVLLAGQVAVQERDRIAVLEPRAKPLVQALCEMLGCSVGPLRQIDAVVIDGSSFNRVRGDAYRLSLTVRNQAPLPIAMPAIELTLTDGQDQPVLRRVLMPAELGAATAELAANGEWSGTLALSVAGGVGRVAGYRVLAFYP